MRCPACINSSCDGVIRAAASATLLAVLLTVSAQDPYASEIDSPMPDAVSLSPAMADCAFSLTMPAVLSMLPLTPETADCAVSLRPCTADPARSRMESVADPAAAPVDLAVSENQLPLAFVRVAVSYAVPRDDGPFDMISQARPAP